MKEEWRDIKGYEGLYQVSNLGRIKSLERTVKKSDGRSQKLNERILKPGTTSRGGYHRVVLMRSSIRKDYLLHRIVAEAFIPNPDNKPQVNHISGIKTDNRPNNLEWCTAKENYDHAVDTGLINYVGENHPMAKMSRAEALVIINLLKTTNKSHLEIAELCKTNQSNVSQIASGQIWKHLSEGKIKRPADAHIIMSENKVLEIVKLLKETNLTQKEIANLTSTNPNKVCRISLGNTWTHITGGKIERPKKSGSQNK